MRARTGVAPPPAVVIPLSEPLAVSPPVCFCNLSAELVVISEIDIVQIQAIQEPLLLDLAGKILNFPFEIS